MNRTMRRSAVARCFGGLRARLQDRWRAARRWIASAALPLVAMLLSTPSTGLDFLPEGDHVFVQYNPYSVHFHPSPEHVNHNHLINLEYQRMGETRLFGDTGRHLIGYAWFKNSFGQPCWYAYYGREWDLDQWIPLTYAKVSAGILHGYDDQYKNKIPFNKYGYAPGIVPSIGVRWHDISAEAIILGFNGLMFGVGYRF